MSTAFTACSMTRRLYRKEKQFAHESNPTTTVITRKAARKRPVPSYSELATERYLKSAV